jgi:hypothetical protein
VDSWKPFCNCIEDSWNTVFLQREWYRDRILPGTDSFRVYILLYCTQPITIKLKDHYRMLSTSKYS